MAGCDILTLGATAVDVDFVQQYKSLGIDLESDIDSSGESEDGGDESNVASDNSRSDESDSDSGGAGSSGLSNSDNTLAGVSGVSALLAC